jgi:hypothetical protein
MREDLPMDDSLENTLDTATVRLDEVSVTVLSADDALGEVMGWVAAINERWAAEGVMSADVIEKLRKWILRLIQKMQEIAMDVGAQSFAISVGTKQVSVTVTFPPA